MSTGSKGPLVVSALGLVVSIGLGVGLCWRVVVPLVEKAAIRKPPAVVEDKSKGWDFWTIEIENLANELKEERARLRKQSEAIDQRAARIASDTKELERVRADVERIRREIGEKVVEISADEAKNIRALSLTYANLTPRAAVTIFRELDDTTAVKILSLMKADVVGPIFEEMSRAPGTGDVPLARRAAVLSEKLRLMKAAKS